MKTSKLMVIVWKEQVYSYNYANSMFMNGEITKHASNVEVVRIQGILVPK